VVLALALFGYVYSSSRNSDPAEKLSLELAHEFERLKNADDARANHLLGPLPSVPQEAVSEEEADRLDAEFILHGLVHITQLRAIRDGGTSDAKTPRVLQAVQGFCSSERFLVQSPQGTERSQRILSNPDIIVEVRDGKLHGVQVQMHRD
jgi:hypothetical protein